MEEQNSSPGRESYIQKKEQKEKEKQKLLRRGNARKFAFGFLIVLTVIGAVLALWFLILKTVPSEAEIVARQGIHWHPEISVKILGEEEHIPANMGLGFSESPVHTHEGGGVIHLEFSGFVKKEDIKLSRFFDVWGKKFDQNCIFDHCSGPEGRLRMFVDGQENFEFENLAMRDKQKIEIVFE